jgi:hypothetical protein
MLRILLRPILPALVVAAPAELFLARLRVMGPARHGHLHRVPHMSKDNGGPGWWFPILLGPNAALTILSTWIGETVGAFSYNQQDSRIWRAKMDRQNRADPRRDDSRLHDDTRQPG